MIIVNAEYIADFSLRLYFSDGVVNVVDFGEYISNNPHPQHDKYLDPELFKTFSLENGNVVWGEDWDMVFPIEDLYVGKI